MTLPEMEPVMPALATIALHRTTATAPNFRTDPVRQVTVEAPCHEKWQRIVLYRFSKTV
jgi:hypothetical protein